MTRTPVWSCNEWDPLEEVVVGSPDHAHLSQWDAITRAVVDETHESFSHQATPYPPELVEAAQDEAAQLVDILERFGVTVRRPDRTEMFGRSYATPFWKWPCGKHAANPRDLLLVTGDLLVEAPTPRRSRHFEIAAYRNLLRDYHRAGARWVAAPTPLLTDELFVEGFHVRDGEGGDGRDSYPITEAEPVFDAADFLRCGTDIFFQQSFVTNRSGIGWLAQLLGERYRFHEVRTRCRTPVHIDTTIVLLCPGKVLLNPEFVVRHELPDCLRAWDARFAPPPVPRGGGRTPFQVDSGWLSMNVLSLDPSTVVVDDEQVELIRLLERWGFDVVPTPIQSYYPFGGGLHCCTLDVRRRTANLERYV